FHDQQVLAVELHFRAAPLAEQDTIAGLDVGRNDLAAVVAGAGADCFDDTLRRLFLCRVGNDDAASGFLFAVDAPNDHAVVQGTEAHVCSYADACENGAVGTHLRRVLTAAADIWWGPAGVKVRRWRWGQQALLAGAADAAGSQRPRFVPGPVAMPGPRG